MANRDADGPGGGASGGPSGGRVRRALLWVGLVGAAIGVAEYATEGRTWLAVSFAVLGVSFALQHPRLSGRSPTLKRAGEIGVAAGFVSVALLVWIPTLPGNGP